MELTKPEKKLARELIAKGLKQEYEKAISDIAALISDWKDKKGNSQDTYMALYKTLTTHDKHIAQRYNYVTGSEYLMHVKILYVEGLLVKEDLEGFAESSKQYLLRSTINEE